MKCNRIQTLLADYSLQRLRPSEVDEVRSHLTVCAFCSRLLQEEAMLSQCLEGLPSAAPASSREMWGAVAAGLETMPARRGLDWGWLARRTAPLAAVATGAAAVAGLFFYATQPTHLTPSTVASLDTHVPRILTISKEMNREVDDPLADHTDTLFAAVDQVTQTNGSSLQ